MPYTNVWNEGFPPDTQQANLLGQDIRSAKLDFRERIASFGAGLLANRPTPEASFAGVTYLATDTGKIYQWSGTAWMDITPQLLSPKTLYESPGAVFHTGATTPAVIYSYTIPGGTLGPNDHLDVEFAMNYSTQQTSQATFLTLYIGSAAVQQYSNVKATGLLRYKVKLVNNNLINAQYYWAEVVSTVPGIFNGPGSGTQTIDFSQDQTVSLQVQNNVAGDAQFFYYLNVIQY